MTSITEESEAEMAARASILVENFVQVVGRINAVASATRPVRLVAVSKKKPASDILALYSATKHLHMGENYAQELLEKAPILPSEIKWHFIGALQTNKCRQLAEDIPNLWAVESVDVAKKADALEKGRASLIAKNPEAQKLAVFVQVNTSGENLKSGCAPSKALALAKHISEACPHLIFKGLMTIGDIVRSKKSDAPNEDFLTLKETRDGVAEGLGCDPELLELSMGMSSDFEQAIGLGATNVRVGTTIFGTRPLKEEEADNPVKDATAETVV